MSGARKITVEFLGKDTSAGKTATDVEKKFGKMGGQFEKAGQVAGKVLAGGLVLAGAAAVKMANAAAEDQKAAALLANTMRNSAHATKSTIDANERWISTMGRAYGIADDDLRPALGRLVAVTHDVDKAQRLAALAADIAAARNLDLTSVSQALAKAQTGSVAGLAKLGIKTKDLVTVQGKQKTVTISADEAMRRLSKTYGGSAAKAAETVEGRQRRASLAFSEFREELGYKLLPVMEKASAIGLSMVDWIDKNQKTVGILAVGITGLVTAVWSINVAMKSYLAITKAITAVTKLAAVAQGALNIAMRMNPIGLVVTALVLLGAGLVLAYKKSETFRDIVDGAFKAVAAAGKWMWNNILAPVFELWGKALGSVMFVWGKLLQALGKVPGFGWVGDLGDKLVGASKKAMNLDLKLDDVAKNRKGTITIDAKTTPATKALLKILKGKGASVGGIAIGGGGNPLLGDANGGRMWAGVPRSFNENGQEVFVPDVNGTAVPSHKVAAMLGGSGGGSSDITVSAPLILQLDSTNVWQGLVKMKRVNGIVSLGLS